MQNSSVVTVLSYPESIAVMETGLAMSGRHPMFMAALAVTNADLGESSRMRNYFASTYRLSLNQHPSA